MVQTNNINFRLQRNGLRGVRNCRNFEQSFENNQDPIFKVVNLIKDRFVKTGIPDLSKEAGISQGKWFFSESVLVMEYIRDCAFSLPPIN